MRRNARTERRSRGCLGCFEAYSETTRWRARGRSSPAAAATTVAATVPTVAAVVAGWGRPTTSSSRRGRAGSCVGFAPAAHRADAAQECVKPLGHSRLQCSAPARMRRPPGSSVGVPFARRSRQEKGGGRSGLLRPVSRPPRHRASGCGPPKRELVIHRPLLKPRDPSS